MTKQINIKKYISKDIIMMDNRFIGEKTPNDFLKLNNNESMYKLPTSFIEDLQTKISNIDFTKYPSNNLNTIKQGISNLYNCDSNQIFVDNGSSMVLERIFHAILSSGDTVVSPTPSFVLYSYFCKLTHSTFLEVDYESNWKFPEEELLDMNANMIIFANPNNPTGTYITPQQIESLLSKTNKIVVVDEAYIEFGGESVVPLVKLYPNLIVIRTISKSFQSAGIRIGFAIMHPELVIQIEKIQPPFNIDKFKQQYIISLLKYKSEFVDFINIIKDTRLSFQKSLIDLGFKLTESYGNFVFIYGHNDNISLKDLHLFLKNNKIMVMYYPNMIYDRDYIRISIGTNEQMDLVLENIKTFLKK